MSDQTTPLEMVDKVFYQELRGKTVTPEFSEAIAWVERRVKPALAQLIQAERQSHQAELDRQKPTEFICCPQLDKSLGDHRGLYVQTTIDRVSGKEDALICYIGGEYTYRKGPIIIHFCPFCGKPRVRLSELQRQKEGKA
jgi:hypothetical protein